MRRSLILAERFRCGDVRFQGAFVSGGFDSPLDFAQMLRDEGEIRQRRGWDRLLVLAGDFEQPTDAVHVLGCQRQIPPQCVGKQFLQIGNPVLLCGVFHTAAFIPLGARCDVLPGGASQPAANDGESSRQ